MDETSVTPPNTEPPVDRGSATSRRGFLSVLTVALGGLIGLVLAVPGAAYVLSPLRKRKPGREGGYRTLTRLKELEVGVPRSFAIIEERQDAWVKYPREPVGSVWLIRQPEGSDPPVDRLDVGVPSPGLRDQPDGGWQGLPLPVPHQRVRPDREAAKPGAAPTHGSARRRAAPWATIPRSA